MISEDYIVFVRDKMREIFDFINEKRQKTEKEKVVNFNLKHKTITFEVDGNVGGLLNCRVKGLYPVTECFWVLYANSTIERSKFQFFFIFSNKSSYHIFHNFI